MTDAEAGVVACRVLGSRRLYITLADGSTPLTGSAESLWKTMLSAERPALDFEWAPTARRFKSRKTVERTRSPAGKTAGRFPAPVLGRSPAASSPVAQATRGEAGVPHKSG